MRIVLAAAVILVAAVPGCGGDNKDGAARTGPPLAWAAEPRLLTAPTADRAKILQGVVRNNSAGRVELEAEDLTVRERDGAEVRASAVFLSGYVRPGEAQNRGPGATLSGQEAERLGKLVRMAPGATAPLTVSWRTREGRAVRIEYPGGSLLIPSG